MDQLKLDDIITKMEDEAQAWEKAEKRMHPYKGGKYNHTVYMVRLSYRLVASELRAYVKALKGI